MANPPDPKDSVDLAYRASRGDVASMGTLLERYLPRLRAFVRLRVDAAVRQRESCSDLVQSVCREVLEHAGQFQYPGEAAFRRWLFTMAARKVGHRHEYWAAERRDPAREEAAGMGAEADSRLLGAYRAFCSPSGEASAREAVARIEAAFDRLPEHYRQVILMARLLGMSRAEIAREIDKSEAAVGNLLFRALAVFAEELDRT